MHQTWSRLCAHEPPGYDNAVYLSERDTADRNFALAYFMRESNAFPKNTDIHKTLDFYFQCCFLQGTTEQLSIMAATLAGGGVCPFTGEQVFAPDTVQKCLSLMYSCGMYDFSGEWAFRIGLPAKSGVSGLILVVIPNVMGFACWSPRLDRNGNSVRGIEFCKELINTFNFHNYDNISSCHHRKFDPRKQAHQDQQEMLSTLFWAASSGDVSCIRRLLARDVDLNMFDYDKRTALHIAASEGKEEVVSFMLAHGARADFKDRWGNTALDDARRVKHKALINTLETALKN
ncbi:glutaminase [Endozoicomonas sp.]|uniref:glutaminase n=1 Tax=Endozoicomonas sp. TaxID=1892382 RepID=UPI002887202A|nr:glutaminase [Endozoicomonas sp.]